MKNGFLEEKQYNPSETSTTDLTKHENPSRNFSSNDKAPSRVYLSVKAEMLPSIFIKQPPIPPAQLFGREQEVSALSSLLQRSDVRLVTVTGVGGVGKTSLSLQVLPEVFPAFSDGICFISLASIETGDQFLSAIIQALGHKENPEQNSYFQIQNAIQGKQFLLVLDNFEHIVDAAPYLPKLLAICPQLKMLVTSRTILRLLEEREFALSPLTLPNLAHLPPPDQLSRVASVAFFLNRVCINRHDFALTQENALTVAKLCIHLEGLPLALELAAARMNLLSPQSLLDRLDHRLSILTRGTRDAPARQQTLRKAIEWSYHLLTSEEKQLFRRLSIFVGGCSIHAVEAISRSLMEYDEQLLNAVTSLLDHNLLKSKAQRGNSEQRFIMLEIVREYGCEQLQDSDEKELISQAHAYYYLAFTEKIKLSMLKGDMFDAKNLLEVELKNLRVAFEWFFSKQDIEHALQISGTLGICLSQSCLEEGHRLGTQALEHNGISTTKIQEETRAQAFYVDALFEYNKLNWLQVEMYASESLRLFQTIGEPCHIAKVHLLKGIAALARGDYDNATASTIKCIQALRKNSNTSLLIEAFVVMAYSASFQNNHQQAYILGKKGLALSRSTDEPFIKMKAIHAQAVFAQEKGDCEEVQAIFKEGMEITHAAIKAGDPMLLVFCLISLGVVATQQKKYMWSARLWGKAKFLFKEKEGGSELKTYEWPAFITNTYLLCSKSMEQVYTQLGEQDFAGAWLAGQSSSVEQVLIEPECAEASPTSPTPKVPVTYADGLTPREQDVLRLLAQGLSSAQIAEELIISVVTVNSHVRTIYSKLGVSSRSAATRYALEHHLV